MAPTSRVDELRRRVSSDPTSIAFAALAEEYRKLGQFADAIDTCRAGLLRHPTYHSARVTLARCLLETSQREAARAEFEQVIKAAPQNLLARKGLADVLRRQGDLMGALEHLRHAAMLAPQDPDVRETIWGIERGMAVSRPTAVPPPPPNPVPAIRMVPPPPAPVIRLQPAPAAPSLESWPPPTDDDAVKAHVHPAAPVASLSEARSARDVAAQRQLEALQDLLALIERTKLGRSGARP